MTPVQLPEVPEPATWCEAANLDWYLKGRSYVLSCATKTACWAAEPAGLYTAAQLREYATEAVMAEMVRLAEAVEALQEYRPRAQKHPHASKGFVVGMSKKAATCEGEDYGHLNKGDVLALLTPSETNSER